MRISLPSGTPADLHLPPGGRGGRGLVVAPDVFGLRPQVDEMCARLAAEQGWVVCAVEPWPGRSGWTREQKFAAMPSMDDRATLRDLEEAADATQRRDVALIGFCMGGMQALRVAGFSSRFDRCVAFYGMIRVPEAWRGPHQREPLEALSSPFARPCLAIVGGKDPYSPADDVAALASVNPNVHVEVYPQAGHAFAHDPERPEHRPADAADAWRRAIAFLEGVTLEE